MTFYKYCHEIAYGVEQLRVVESERENKIKVK